MIVIDSREKERDNATRRRRACIACEHRFTTMEFVKDDVRKMKEENQDLHRAILALAEVVKKYEKERE